MTTRRKSDPQQQPTFDQIILPAAPKTPESSVKVINPQVVLHEGDNQVTRVKLVQSTNAEGTPGLFYAAATSEEFAELFIVPIKVQARGSPSDYSGISADRLICRLNKK